MSKLRLYVMAKVLVTGANGFIGSHLVEALMARGDEVTCLVRERSDLTRLRGLDVALVRGDVTQRDTLPSAISGHQIVYHVAGRTRAFRAEQLFEVNQRGVRKVAEACAEQATPPVLVVVSSLAAAGPAIDGRPRTESDRPAPVSVYGRSKLSGEQAARALADRVPVTIVRPPMVLGEWDRQGLMLFRTIRRFGVHVVPGLGRSEFSLIHADDLAQLLILAAERGARAGSNPQAGPAWQGCYFAACERDPSYADLGRQIGAAVGRSRVLVMPTPPRAVWAVAAVNEVVSRILRKPAYLSFDKAREVRAGSWVCSPQAAVDELGFSVAARLPDRLCQIAAWYRRVGWL